MLEVLIIPSMHTCEKRPCKTTKVWYICRLVVRQQKNSFCSLLSALGKTKGKSRPSNSEERRFLQRARV
jgi:hypothetical protein